MPALSPAQKAAATRRLMKTAAAQQQVAAAKGAPVSIATLANSTSLGVVNHAAKIDISKLSYAELLSLNATICARLKQLSTIRQAQAQQQFTVGQRVRFTTKQGLPVVGKITSFGPKNVKLTAETGVRWVVAPTHLSAA